MITLSYLEIIFCIYSMMCLTLLLVIMTDVGNLRYAIREMRPLEFVLITLGMIIVSPIILSLMIIDRIEEVKRGLRNDKL